MSFGAYTFLAPLGLLGLLVLPLIFWLLKATPPSPKNESFPPIKILADVLTEEETPDRTPLWLLLFRIALVTLLAIALARPVMTRQGAQDVRPLLLVVDNDYGAAANWGQIMREAEARVTAARRANVNVALAFTRDDAQVKFEAAGVALETLKSSSPLPLAADYGKTTQRLAGLDISGAQAVWLSGGLQHGDASDMSAVLTKAAATQIVVPASERSPILAGGLTETERGFRSLFYRVDTASLRESEAVVYSSDGSVIARAPMVFSPGNKSAEAEFELPADLRNRIARISPDGASGAGAVRLLDDSWGRPVVGIIDNGQTNIQPLLSDVYYVEKAVGDNADVFKAPFADLLPLGPSIIIMSDSARTDEEALVDFVEAGGLLIRFAGPKLAARADDLLPVELRFGGRAMGGALTWEDPQGLEAFAQDSPFFGLKIPDDVTVSQQVMAQPGGETDGRTWARLSDGSPVVTAAARGQGRIVLFHVTSGPEWSNLAVSGLYVDMLKRIYPLARQAPAKIQAQSGSWSAQRVLDGFGRLTAPPAGLQPIADGAFDDVVISETHLPGLYRQGARLTALNAVRNPKSIGSLAGLPNVTRDGYGSTRRSSLEGVLLAIGVGLLALDAILAIWVSGRGRRLLNIFKPRKAVLGLALAGLFIWPQISDAQTRADFTKDSTGLHLAYVLTGDARLDRLSEAGLRGVTLELFRRTTVEPQPPRGVNLETDTLSIYPLIYWPVTRGAQALSDAQAANVNAYMAAGGTVIFDTMDAGDQISGLSGSHPGLARISENLDIPPLTAIPDDHVLGKSFFLLAKFPGRWADGTVYVDANGIAARDGVASVIVGGNDWANAWAVSEDDNFIGVIDETMPRQREFANRFGVNLVMYVLSGNYKADQVHYPSILERLGPAGTSMQKTPSVQDPDR